MSDRELLFGSDLALTDAAPGFDLGVARGGDLALAEGIDNIVQALRLRLLVRLGEMAPLGLPRYGSRLHELLALDGSLVLAILAQVAELHCLPNLARKDDVQLVL